VEHRVIAGRYRLVERLGRGGMAEVWLAEDLELERRVALKLLGPRADPARFDREARAAASLAHPHICLIYDYGEDAGQAFMVLEHLPGGTLEDRLTPGRRLPDAEAGVVARQVAAGLAHAHQRGVVHRDLKPANILFDGAGRAKIADFGIARLGGEGTLTEAGTLLGTAAYLSPEQASGRPAAPASDVYSFGVILYRLLSGRPPFESTSAVDLVRRHREEVPPALASVRPDVPDGLARVAMAALEKDASARPADGSALLAALEAGSPTEALRPEARTEVIPFAKRRRGVRRRSLALPLLAAPLLAAGLGLAFVATRDSESRPAPPSTDRPASSATPPTTAEETEGGGVKDTTGETAAGSTSEETTTEAASTRPPPTATTAPPTRETTDPTTTRPEATTATTAPTTTEPPPTATTTPAATTEPGPTTTAPAPTTTAPPPATTEPLPTTGPPPTTEPPPTTAPTTTAPPPATTEPLPTTGPPITTIPPLTTVPSTTTVPLP